MIIFCQYHLNLRTGDIYTMILTLFSNKKPQTGTKLH